MNEQFESIIFSLLQPAQGHSIFDPTAHFDTTLTDKTETAKALNAAFLIRLAGSRHPASAQANHFLEQAAATPEWAEIARFYSEGVERIQAEIEAVCEQNQDFATRLKALAEWLSEDENRANPTEVSEKTWSVFFPEATGIRANHEQKVEALRAKRTVRLTNLAPAPITEPARQILFTSNVLLTNPAANTAIDELPFSPDLLETLRQSAAEPQLYWFDHPIQIGVELEKNEILYGLRGLEATLEFERTRGNLPEGARVACVLSVSVTHAKLQEVARQYLEEEVARSGGLKHLDVYTFTEADTRRIITEILAPAAQHYLHHENAAQMLEVLGVDGEYGRHYTFLKAILALWNGLIEPEIKATFKIDLDQVFPQKELVEQTGASALEHFKSPLWGAQGLDSQGQPLELGMLAGALVNERDISKSLFYPDVLFPTRNLTPDEYVFFSGLPQALSTEAEMMTRYNGPEMDGQHQCIQRIHVTGGTNGILVDSLRRYRPFTPSFMGRAEDQAYLLSVLLNPGPRLAYAHQDGLIMRHDKEAFAFEAMKAAEIGKQVGDYIRLLHFSAYARTLAGDINRIKEIIDPFTGCFVSAIPTTVALLRFSLKAATFFANGKNEQGVEFISNGAPRITNALAFVDGENSPLRQTYEKERQGWNLYYDILAALETALNEGDPFALQMRDKAQNLIDHCHIKND